MCETDPNTPDVEPSDPPALEGGGEALPSVAENAALPHIDHPLVACFEVGMLLNQLDFQLRVAYMAWDQQSFAAADDSWTNLLVAVWSIRLPARDQSELCQIIERHRDCRREVYFSEGHRDYLDDFGDWDSVESYGGWFGALERLFGSQGPTREIRDRLLDNLSNDQILFLEVGELLDRGDHSSYIPWEAVSFPDTGVSICDKGSGGNPVSVANSGLPRSRTNVFPVRAVERVPVTDREAWLRTMRVSWQRVLELLRDGNPEAHDIEFTNEQSVGELADGIRQAITAAVASTDDSTPDNKFEEAPYLGVTMNDETGIVARAGFGEITLHPRNRQLWNLLKHLLGQRGNYTPREWLQSQWKTKGFGTKSNPKKSAVYKAFSELGKAISDESLALNVESKGNIGWRLVCLKSGQAEENQRHGQ